jgi:hypothetical protein
MDKGLNLVPREGPPTYNCKKLSCCCIVKSKYQNHGFGRGSGPSLGPRRERRRLQTHGGVVVRKLCEEGGGSDKSISGWEIGQKMWIGSSS